ncbi:hypothetical protein BJX61DRAFT_537053 [Aspergillus egyptiacus]|nr:hypothetical protein BJX61DRAFT_537053 [Aspergillus egyptiacus]
MTRPAGHRVSYPAGRSPADEWYGVLDAKERRKRQNRINQRAHRLRTRLEQAGLCTSPNTQSYLHPVKSPLNIESTSQSQSTLSEQGADPRPEPDPTLPDPVPSRSSKDGASSPAQVSTLSTGIPDADKTHILLRKMAQFYSSYQLNSPSADHLLSLTRINVHRAFVSNMLTLGITWEWMADDSISPLSMASPGGSFLDLGHAVVPLPDSLRPTPLQRNHVHHTWIDLFPCPIMRDNLIRVGNDWDDEELCTDIMGFWDGTTATGPFGLIIWGEPSDLRSWEITEGFLRKWGWVVHGCVELMWSTNYWRARRGERPLFSMREVYRLLGTTSA